MTIHVEVNGKVVLEDCPAEDERITLRLSPEAAKALKYLCGSASGGVFSQRKYTTAIFDALPGNVWEDCDKNIKGKLEFLK